MARLSFRCSDELVAAVDAAKGYEPRESWLRRAVEQALGDGLQRGGSDPLAVPDPGGVERSRVRVPPCGSDAAGSSVGERSVAAGAPAELPAERVDFDVLEPEFQRDAETFIGEHMPASASEPADLPDEFLAEAGSAVPFLDDEDGDWFAEEEPTLAAVTCPHCGCEAPELAKSHELDCPTVGG